MKQLVSRQIKPLLKVLIFTRTAGILILIPCLAKLRSKCSPRRDNPAIVPESVGQATWLVGTANPQKRYILGLQELQILKNAIFSTLPALTEIGPSVL
jgi:hypothetical protein